MEFQERMRKQARKQAKFRELACLDAILKGSLSRDDQLAVHQLLERLREESKSGVSP